MKILIYTHEYPPFRGGAGIYSSDLANGFASLGVEVHVATILPELPKDVSRLSNVLSTVQLHYLESWQVRAPSAHYYLFRLQLLHRFDLVVVTERVAQEVVAKIQCPFFRYVTVIHGTEVLDYFGPLSTTCAVRPNKMLRFYRNALVNIAGSKATHDLAVCLIKRKDVKIEIAQYGINLDRLQKVDTERLQSLKDRYPDEAEFIFCLGRLSLDKGHDVLIQAFKLVKEQRPNARLLIGGDGPYMQRLIELCLSLELKESVEFLGNVSDDDLSAYFELCDMFALPSKCEDRWEGFGLVFLEANYYGKPVVGGNEGGAVEAIVNEETGVVVDPRSESAVASAIIRLLEDSELRVEMGQRGLQRVHNYFNSERMATDTFSLLRASFSQETFVSRVKRSVGLVIYGATYPLFILWQGIRKMLSHAHLSFR